MTTNPACSPIQSAIENQKSKIKNVGERQPRESAQSHAAFCVYLELGRNATLQAVANKLGRTLQAVRQLSSRHRWQERAAACRQHTANATLAAIETQRLAAEQLWAFRLEALRELQWERFIHLHMLCNEGLNQLLENPDPKLSIGQLIAFLRLASKFGHSAIDTPVKGAARRSAVPSIDQEIKLLTKLAKACGADPEIHSPGELTQGVAEASKPQKGTLVPTQVAADTDTPTNRQPLSEPEPVPGKQNRHDQLVPESAVSDPTMPINDLEPLVPAHLDLKGQIAIHPRVFQSRNCVISIPIPGIHEPPPVLPHQATRSARYYPELFDFGVWPKQSRAGCPNKSAHFAS